jgi:hypothetical protein
VEPQATLVHHDVRPDLRYQLALAENLVRTPQQGNQQIEAAATQLDNHTLTAQRTRTGNERKSPKRERFG